MMKGLIVKAKWNKVNVTLTAVVVLTVIIIIAIVYSKGKECDDFENYLDGKCVNKCTAA